MRFSHPFGQAGILYREGYPERKSYFIALYGNVMTDAAYGDGFKSFDEGAGQSCIRGMSNYLAVLLHAANDAVIKEPAHESMTIVAAASR